MFGKKKNETNEKVMLGFLVEGLPIQENSDIMLKLSDQNLSFLKHLPEKQEFNISIDKITNINFYTETEMEKVISQSTPGMILGAATFGIVGAMIGGKVKTKEKKVETHFLVVDYTSNGEKQVTIKTNYPPDAINLVDYFRKLKPNVTPIKVEL